MRSCFAFLWIAGSVVIAIGSASCTKSSDGDGGDGGSSSGNTSNGGTSSGTSGSTSGGASGDVPAKPSKVTTTSEAIEVDGSTRHYVLQVPKTYDAAKSYPLIVALHGDGDDAMGFSKGLNMETFSGDDAILAYCDHSEDLFTDYDTNKDQRLIEVMTEALKKKFTIDAAKIWGVGYSKGAYQLNQIACRKAGILKAMAIHAGGAPQDRNNDDSVNCPNAIGLPVFVTHGMSDDPGGGKFGADYWAGLAGCGESMTKSTPAICEAYDGCPAGKPVVFCVVPNQPHSPLYKDAAEHSWNWFKTL